MANSFANSLLSLGKFFGVKDKVGQYQEFDIAGNKLRLIAVVHYSFKKVYIQSILDHREYDKGMWKE